MEKIHAILFSRVCENVVWPQLRKTENVRKCKLRRFWNLGCTKLSIIIIVTKRFFCHKQIETVNMLEIASTEKAFIPAGNILALRFRIIDGLTIPLS